MVHPHFQSFSIHYPCNNATRWSSTSCAHTREQVLEYITFREIIQQEHNNSRTSKPRFATQFFLKHRGFHRQSHKHTHTPSFYRQGRCWGIQSVDEDISWPISIFFPQSGATLHEYWIYLCWLSLWSLSLREKSRAFIKILGNNFKVKH